jgi:hypothetical protein
MGTINGKTHIKTIFSFSQGTGKHFIGNALSSSDGSVKQLIHALHFFTIVSFRKPKRKIPEESYLANEGARKWVARSFYPMIRKSPVQIGTNTTGDMGWYTRKTVTIGT